MTVLVQQLANGLTLGTVYALVALGYTMIFGVLELIAFAQAGVYMVGAFVGLATVTLLGVTSLPGLAAAILVAAAASGLLNLTVDRVAYRPLRHAGRLAPLISGIGVYIFIENGMGALVGQQPRAYPPLLPHSAFSAAGVRLTVAQLIVAGIALVCMVGLTLLVRRTDTGLAMRAVAERPETASLMAIDPERIVMVTFCIGGALAGVAGVLIGSYVGVVTPTMGFLVGIKAFAAAVIGGIGNIPGALLGGLVVGLIEALGAGYVSSAWSDAIVFGVLILMLMARPYGILGASLPERA